MKILFQCLLFLGCNAVALSAEILAWKTPLTVIAPEGVNDTRATRLEKPPESSPFFGPKDELWDIADLISKSGRDLLDPPEWIVWNATSGRLVAKVSWTAFLELQFKWNLKNPPIQSRVKVDVYEVAADGSPPDHSKPSKHSLSVSARSGQKTLVANFESEASISLECEPEFSDDLSVVDLKTVISVALADGTSAKLNTQAALRSGTPLWLARTFDGKNGIDIIVTATIELVDGSPYAELVMIQEGDTIMPFPGDFKNRKSGNIELGNEYSLIWYPIPIEKLLSLIGPSGDTGYSKSDPFAPVGAGEPQYVLLDKIKFKSVVAPHAVAQHVQGIVFDVRDLFKGTGINVPKGDLIGYDYKNQRVFIYSSDIGELHKFQKFFMGLEYQPPTSLAITARGNEELRLLSRSGSKSSMESTYSKSKQSHFFEMEPFLGEMDTYVDARFSYHEKIDGKIIQSLDTSATLETGKFLKLFEKGKADGTKEAMEVKVEVLGHHR